MSMTSARARHNSLKRYRPDDDPVVLEARRDLAAERLADYIQKTVDRLTEVPLTEDQKSRLSALLRPGGAVA